MHNQDAVDRSDSTLIVTFGCWSYLAISD